MSAVNTALLCQIANASDTPPPPGPTFPAGATHYWAFENDLLDGVGAFDLIDEGVDSFPAGKHNLGVAVGDGGSAGTDANVLPLSGTFSFATWIFLPAGSDFNWGSVPILFVSGGNFVAKIGGTADTLVGPAVVFDQWHLLVITYDGSSVEKLSVDGGVFVSGTTTVELADANVAWRSVAGTPVFDESAFWARALTQQEAIDMWNGGTGLFGP